MCAENILLIKPLQHISGSLNVHEMTQRFLIQKMKGVNSVSELIFQCALLC